MKLLLCIILMCFTPFLFAAMDEIPNDGDLPNGECFDLSTAFTRMKKSGDSWSIYNLKTEKKYVLTSGNNDIPISHVDEIIANLPKTGRAVRYCFMGEDVSVSGGKVVHIEFERFQEIGAFPSELLIFKPRQYELYYSRSFEFGSIIRPSFDSEMKLNLEGIYSPQLPIGLFKELNLLKNPDSVIVNDHTNEKTGSF